MLSLGFIAKGNCCFRFRCRAQRNSNSNNTIKLMRCIVDAILDAGDSM